MNRYGYRHLVARTDAEANSAPAVIDARAEKLQRREKDTNRPFIPALFDELENQWNGLRLFAQGFHPDMSTKAAFCCQEELARVFKFRPVQWQETVRHGKHRRLVNRVEFKDVGLPQCQCDDGSTHYSLDVDRVLDEIKALMPQVLQASEADETHNIVWAIDGLCAVLANHGVRVNYDKLWHAACPPLRRTIPTQRLAAYKAWDEKWHVVGEDHVNDEVIIERPLLDRFHRAKLLLSEEAARGERRPYDPPADWEPPVEPDPETEAAI